MHQRFVLLLYFDLLIFFKKGDLRSFIQSLGKNITWKQIITISTSISQGMICLHSHEPPIIHCDLKSNNVLVFNDFGECKITDFGLAQIDGKNVRSDIIYDKIEPPEGQLSIQSDIFMFGLLLFEVCTL
jgi:serine/threonine protein kinase